MRIATGLALDGALVCLFAAIGRHNHSETSALAALISRRRLVSERR